MKRVILNPSSLEENPIPLKEAPINNIHAYI